MWQRIFALWSIHFAFLRDSTPFQSFMVIQGQVGSFGYIAIPTFRMVGDEVALTAANPK
jgi:hypothetical protein